MGTISMNIDLSYNYLLIEYLIILQYVIRGSFKKQKHIFELLSQMRGRICISVSKRKIVQEILGYPLPCCMDVVKPVLWNLWKDPSENFEGVFSKMYVPLLHQLLHHESLQKPLFYCCSGLLIQTFPMNILRVLPKHLLRSCVHFCKTILLKTLKGSFRKGLFRCCISFHI